MSNKSKNQTRKGTQPAIDLQTSEANSSNFNNEGEVSYAGVVEGEHAPAIQPARSKANTDSPASQRKGNKKSNQPRAAPTPASAPEFSASASTASATVPPAPPSFSSPHANPLHLNPEAFPSVQEVKIREQQQSQEHEKKAPSAVRGESAFVKRVSKIPTVAKYVDFLNESVVVVSKSNKVAKLAIDTTRNTVSYGVSVADRLASPVKPMIEPVLEKIDIQANSLLMNIQSKYPILNKQPGDIAEQVRITATSTADATAQRALSYRPVSYLVSVGARSLLSVNSGVDSVLHKTRLIAPNTHNHAYNHVDKLAHGVLEYVQGSRSATIAVA